LVIEDSESGVVAAKAAGMKVIAVPNKYTKHQDFSKADKIVENSSQITMETLSLI
jgi:beta-phosphoglucomutase-like phosphatase (HAD superfamily)